MPRAIHRTSIPVDGKWHTIRLTGPILHVATRQEARVEFWHLHDDSAPVTRHELQAFGTGHELPGDAAYVGTALDTDGFVWHLMERKEG